MTIKKPVKKKPTGNKSKKERAKRSPSARPKEIRTCKMCMYPKKSELERAYFTGLDNVQSIANKIGCSHSAVSRHLRHHVPLNDIIVVTETAVELQKDGAIQAFEDLSKNVVRLNSMADILYSQLDVLNLDLSDKERMSAIFQMFDGIRKQYETLSKIFELQLDQQKKQGTLNKLIIEMID